ncbi:acyl-CoA dehydrogenase family protein (plasmid) [Tistrella bauzanensis]|uniref:acyl-CoA dehydrogenase family protein n=1 Tax=Tistrella TaxID=171436 RepID=UPI0031F66DC1
MRSPFLSADHLEWQDTLRRWVAREITPFVNEWDEAESFPRDLYRKAAEIGLLGLGYPEEYGGVPADRFMAVIAGRELARCGAGGVPASLLSHTIGSPPILKAGSADLKARVLPGILAGEKISALAITEPNGGSDVASIRTKARLDGDHYVVSGEKTFITSGMRADYYTVAVRTGGPGRGGISLLVVEADSPGFSRTPLKKMGWWSSDTATLHFDEVRVPACNLIGEEGSAFRTIMLNFNDERIALATTACAFARVCVDEAIAYARERVTFGQPLAQHQVIRHKLVDMAQRVEVTEAFIERLVWCLDQGDNPIAQICMAKNQATQTMAHCASQAVQIFGGAGYMRGTTVERIYREVKVNAIGGGAEEIMTDLASRQMGL